MAGSSESRIFCLKFFAVTSFSAPPEYIACACQAEAHTRHAKTTITEHCVILTAYTRRRVVICYVALLSVLLLADCSCRKFEYHRSHIQGSKQIIFTRCTSTPEFAHGISQPTADGACTANPPSPYLTSSKAPFSNDGDFGCFVKDKTEECEVRSLI